MVEKYNFIGENLTPERKKSAEEVLNNWHESAKTKSEKEIEKTPEDSALIEKAKDILNQELKSLNVQPDFDLNPEIVHIISSDEITSSGFYYEDSREIEIIRSKHKIVFLFNVIEEFVKKILYRNRKKRDSELATIIHEFIHSTSHNKYLLKKNRDGQRISCRRTGYKTKRDWEHTLFDGFDEAIVDKLSNEIVLKQYKVFEKNNVRNNLYKSLTRFLGGYPIQIKIIEKIIKKIAEVKNEAEEEVWKRFKIGEFTGNMMHLRDVENAYGPGSLRILAQMPGKNGDKEELDAYYDYFATSNEESLNKIQNLYIKKDQKEKLNYHVGKMENTK
ncbi:MAG: hypothetical protein WC662_04350 [Candidatus Paceibacterota bacterium]|jgi:hypothetical protein